MTLSKEFFLSVVRAGIGNAPVFPPNKADWHALRTLAEAQGLYAIVLDGIDNLPASSRPPQELLLEWIGEVLNGYEYRFDKYRRAIAEMANYYNSHGYKMMILKGYACCLDWPKPEHRPLGDIDIWQFGKQKEADDLISSEKGIKVDASHHHHTIFNWGEFTVENHYDFMNVHAHRSSAELEKVFKVLGKDDSYSVDVLGQKINLPSPNLHALFLIKHMVSHFAAAEISLRQVLDWALFVKNHTQEIDWEWLLGVLKEYHMLDFFNIINAICVGDLGFDVSMFKEVQFNPELKDKVLHDILEPKFGAAEPTGLIPRLVYKFRRWQGNAWKQTLCYNESRWESFWSGIWAKMLKPASF